MERYKYFCIRRGLTTIARVRWKIIISYLVLILTVLVLMPAVTSADPDHKFIVSIKSSEIDDDTKIISIEAEDHENYGEEAVKKCKAFFIFLKHAGDLTYNSNKDSIQENLSEWELDSNFDDFLNELEGIRIELNRNPLINIPNLKKVINMGRVLNLNIKTECTLTAATETSTRDENKTFLHQNIDSSIDEFIYNYFHICYVAKIMGKFNYTFWHTPVLGEFPFLNEKGLGFAGAKLGLKSSGPVNTSDDLTDMPSYWLTRRTLMNCSRVTSDFDFNNVKMLWNCSDRASGRDKTWPHIWDNQNMIWCDRFGGILAIEQMHDYFVAKTENPIWPDNPDILWKTCHHMWNETNYTGSQSGSELYEKSSSGPRAERAYELLNDTYYGELTEQIFKWKIAKDIYGGSDNNSQDENDICRNATVRAYIIQPKPGVEKVSWTYGNPYDHDFIDFTFV